MHHLKTQTSPLKVLPSTRCEHIHLQKTDDFAVVCTACGLVMKDETSYLRFASEPFHNLQSGYTLIRHSPYQRMNYFRKLMRDALSMCDPRDDELLNFEILIECSDLPPYSKKTEPLYIYKIHNYLMETHRTQYYSRVMYLIYENFNVKNKADAQLVTLIRIYFARVCEVYHNFQITKKKLRSYPVIVTFSCHEIHKQYPYLDVTPVLKIFNHKLPKHKTFLQIWGELCFLRDYFNLKVASFDIVADHPPLNGLLK